MKSPSSTNNYHPYRFPIPSMKIQLQLASSLMLWLFAI